MSCSYSHYPHSEELVLKCHIRLGLKTNTGTEDVGQSGTLLSKSVDNRGAGRSQRSLEHVAENTENAVEVLEAVLGRGILPLDTGHHLSNDDKINDERRGKQGVLANVEQAAIMLALISHRGTRVATYEIVW